MHVLQCRLCFWKEYLRVLKSDHKLKIKSSLKSGSFQNLITFLVLQGCCWDHIYTLSWIDFPRDHSKIVAFLARPSADYFFGGIKVKMDIQPKLISNKLSPLPASGLLNWCSCQTLFYKHRKNKKNSKSPIR
jgi:hypothetical protein